MISFCSFWFLVKGDHQFQLYHTYERWNQHLRHVECFSSSYASSISTASTVTLSFFSGKIGCIQCKAGGFSHIRLVLTVMWRCIPPGWNNRIVWIFLAWMIQSFVHDWGPPWGGYNSSNVSLHADFPASCLIVLWVKTCILFDWKYLLKHVVYFYFRCAPGYTGNPLLGQRCVVGNEVNGTLCILIQQN